MEGWIKIHRKLITWEWYTDSKMVHLFLHLLLSANHKPNQWQGINVERGQLITGRIKLSVATGISEQSIRTCLLKLEKTKELTIKTTNRNSIITLLNYDSYQINDEIKKELTNNQPTINQQSTTNKNDNKEKKKEYNIQARKLAFKESLFDYVGKYKKETVKAFFEYWSEHGDNDKKMRYEKESSFGVKRRLSTWAKNDFDKTENPIEEKGKGKGGVSMEEMYNS